MKIDSDTLQALATLLKAVGGNSPAPAKQNAKAPVHAPRNKPVHKPYAQAPPRQNYAPQPRQAEPLPGFMKRLDVKCFSKEHFAPVPMDFIRFTTSANGHPVAHYKCAACGASQFWALSPESKAFVLFNK